MTNKVFADNDVTWYTIQPAPVTTLSYITRYTAQQEQNMVDYEHRTEFNLIRNKCPISLLFWLKGLSHRHIAQTHWGPNKMAALLQTFSNAFSWMKMYVLLFKFHCLLLSVWLMQALIQVMAWRRTGTKPVSESMLTKFYNAIPWQLGL